MICKDCAIEEGGQAFDGVTTARITICPECRKEKICFQRYKFGLKDKEHDTWATGYGDITMLRYTTKEKE